MKIRSALLLLLTTATLLAWTYIHYQYQQNHALKLEQLSRLPMYVYLADSTRVDSLTTQLKQIPQIRTLTVESGSQAVSELVAAYQLPITESMLEEYTFPSVVTVIFNGELASLAARQRVLNILSGLKIEPNDIDSQSLAWELLEKELELLSQRWSDFIIFSAVLVLLLIIFSQISLYFHFLLQTKKEKSSIIDHLQMHRTKLYTNFLLLFLPMLINLGTYFGLVYYEQIKDLVDWLFFVIQFGTVLTGTLIALIVINVQQYGMMWSPGLITVSMPADRDGPDS